MAPVEARDRTRDLRLAGAVAAGTALVGSVLELGTLCPLRRATGVPCPLCGLTTGVWAAAHGDVSAALTAHPLALPVIAGLALAWTPWGVDAIGRLGRRTPALVVVLSLVWFARLAGVYGS